MRTVANISVDSVLAFKNVLILDKPVVPKHYLFGYKSSVLNHNLYWKNISNSPLCRCNNIKTVKHFFRDYPINNNQRITLMQTVSRFCAITLDTLLYGNSNLSLQANSDIFEAVQLF